MFSVSWSWTALTIYTGTIFFLGWEGCNVVFILHGKSTVNYISEGKLNKMIVFGIYGWV